MTRYRNDLPQLRGGLFLTDGGMETTLMFHRGIELPFFSTLPLLRTPEGVRALCDYFAPYLDIVKRARCGFVVETATWRASPDWAERLGMTPAEAVGAMREAVGLVEQMREEHDTPETPIVVSGNIGPRGDGYVAGDLMTPTEAEAYHRPQVETFAGTTADMVCAMTMTNAAEATGIAAAAKRAGMPAAISFTVETDGRLPTGQPLGEAIAEVDDATGGAPAYYMINCAHPVHFVQALDERAPWIGRLRGLRANASTCSHAELDAMTELDTGDPADLGRRYGALVARLPHINVLGGCCGTDHRHIESIGAAVRVAA